MDVNLSKLWEMVKDGEPGMLYSIGSQRVRDNLATEQQQHHHCLVLTLASTLKAYLKTLEEQNRGLRVYLMHGDGAEIIFI